MGGVGRMGWDHFIYSLLYLFVHQYAHSFSSRLFLEMAL